MHPGIAYSAGLIRPGWAAQFPNGSVVVESVVSIVVRKGNPKNIRWVAGRSGGAGRCGAGRCGEVRCSVVWGRAVWWCGVWCGVVRCGAVRAGGGGCEIGRAHV